MARWSATAFCPELGCVAPWTGAKCDIRPCHSTAGTSSSCGSCDSSDCVCPASGHWRKRSGMPGRPTPRARGTAAPPAATPSGAGRPTTRLRPQDGADGPRGAGNARRLRTRQPGNACRPYGPCKPAGRNPRQRAQLSLRSAVPVLDRLLAARREATSKIGSRLAPRIGHRKAGRDNRDHDAGR